MKEILFGILCGLLVALCMRYIPIFHGPNSNIIRNKSFKDDKNRSTAGSDNLKYGGNAKTN